MQKEDDPKLVTKEAVQAISLWSKGVLEKYAANIPEAQLVSSATRKSVAKRLSENGAKKFTTIRSLPLLVSSEVLSYCERIRIYPFITQYRVELNKGSPEMIAAWQLHSHSLRQNELYVIHERGGDILDFAHYVATDLGLGSENRAKEFEKRFKKQFDWRLRDRHRVVHAHERPSMTSRLADLMIATDDSTKEDLKDYLMGLLANLSELLPGEKTDDPKEKMRRLLSVRDVYVKAAEEEATQMIEMFVDEMQKTISPLAGVAAK
ncbi:hypothetical protein NFO65_15305 [Neorhizobium galegae]|uniref:hypothetical protein n=1 Tax=Neorhizobium galegae TaxID=399 RepID=UPI002100AE1D|nr:hypothetical protein [Neorhizobium galegae]MCQ1572099.1 hypothetical protein [Neorhizobium galegae]